MADIREVHRRSVHGIQVAIEEASIAYRQAEIYDDVDGMAHAAQQMAGLRASARELDMMARDAYAAQPRNVNRFGLSKDEIEVANTHPDSSMTQDQKQEVYARNKQRYQHMRQTGEYRDDQGSVRR